MFKTLLNEVAKWLLCSGWVAYSAVAVMLADSLGGGWTAVAFLGLLTWGMFALAWQNGRDSGYWEARRKQYEGR